MTPARNKLPKRRNPVAKLAGRFNRAATHRDRKKALKRGALKHRKSMNVDTD
jgi:hypothetical protein